MNQRAFNLFTALVSFVLIMLAVLMVNTMTRTEERAIATVADLQQQSEMQTIADLRRGDAFQYVVFRIRHLMEEYFFRTDVYIPVQKGRTWDQMVYDDFACARMGVNCGSDPGDADRVQLANWISDAITGMLYEGESRGPYLVSLEGYGAEGLIAKPNFERALTEALRYEDATGTDPHPVFELVDCAYDETDPNWRRDCPGGTFYINLRFDKIDNATYEALPRIVVTDYNVTGAVLKTSVLPRSNLRVFVPLRVFQTLARSKEIADKTLFTPHMETTLSNMHIGVCDVSSCAIERRLSSPQPSIPIPAGTGCAGTTDTATYHFAKPGAQPLPLPTVPASIINFDPNSPADMVEKLADYARRWICETARVPLAAELVSDPAERDLKLLTNPADNCVFVNTTLRPNAESRPIMMRWGGVKQFPANQAFCTMFGTAGSSAYQTYASLSFLEQNENYKVRKNSSGTYNVRIYPSWPTKPKPNFGTCYDDCDPDDLTICGSVSCNP